jgi:hypothetical protein
VLRRSRDGLAQRPFNFFIIQSSRIILKDKAERKTFFVIFQSLTAIFIERPATLEQSGNTMVNRSAQVSRKGQC